MSVVPLFLDPNAEARTLLNFMLQHGDIVGTDQAGRTLLQLGSWRPSMPMQRISKMTTASRTAPPSSLTWCRRSVSAGHPASCGPWRSRCCS